MQNSFRLHGSLLLTAFSILFLTGCSVSTHQQKTDSVPVMDLHSDIVLRMIDNGVDIGDPPAWPQTTLQTMKDGNIKNQVFAIWVNSYRLNESVATHRALQMIDEFYLQQAKYSDHYELATTVAEAREINRNGKVAAWMIIEGGAPIANDLRVLRQFHRMGVRGMTLTWSNNLLWAGSATDGDDRSKGLDDFGKDVVREMNRLGMVIDISHVSPQTFYDALELTTDPAIASHSNCYALNPHPRNLTDDQLRALAANGGVVGINALPSFVSADWDDAWDATADRISDQIDAIKAKYDGNTGNPMYRDERRQAIQKNLPEEFVVTLSDYVDHIDHAVSVMGWEHVSIGADYDGIWAFPEGMEKADCWPRVIEELRRRDYTEEMITGIMHDNALRVFEAVIDR